MALRIQDLAVLYIFFAKAAAQPNELLRTLEKNILFSDFHTLCQSMEEDLVHFLQSGLFVTIDYEMGHNRIQISSEHSQGWPLLVYYPRTVQQFETIMESVQNDISYDENIFSGWWRRKLRFICLPQETTEFYNFTTGCRSTVANAEFLVRETVYAWQMDHIAVLQFLSDGQRMTYWKDARECSAGAEVVEEGPTRAELLACLSAAIGDTYDLKNVNLRVLVQMPQDDHEGRSSVESTEFHSKEMTNLLEDFQKLLQFKSELILGRGYPRHLVMNGTRLNGLGQQIMDKEADICIAPVSLSPMRAQMLHFLQPIRFEESAIIYLGKTAMLPSLPLLLHPFSFNLWITFGVFLVSASVTSLCVGITIEGLSLDYIPSRFEPVVFTIAASFNQGGCSGSQHVSIRIVILTASLTSSVLYMAYSGAFVATVSAPASPVHTYNTLKKHGFNVFTDPSMSYGPDFVESVKDQQDLIDNSRRIYQGKMDMVNKVLEPEMKYAAIYRKDMFYSAAFSHNISTREICQTSVITSGKQSRVREALVMRKGSPLREPFNQKNNLLIERGLTKLYRSRYDRRIQPPCKTDWKYFKIIGFQDCLWALGIVAAGSILSIFFFLTEFLLSLPFYQSTVKQEEVLNGEITEHGNEFILVK